jgi:hypothetical protein
MTKHRLAGLFLFAAVAFAPAGFAQQTGRSETAEHPRIAAAIRELEGAIAYMEHAPHDFGGHKARAIEDSRKAIIELREAMHYRAVEDNMKKRR